MAVSDAVGAANAGVGGYWEAIRAAQPTKQQRAGARKPRKSRGARGGGQEETSDDTSVSCGGGGTWSGMGGFASASTLLRLALLLQGSSL